MAENVRVVVRCRPMNRREQEMQCKNIVEIDNCAVNLLNSSDPTSPAKMFTFDNAYDDKAPTEVLYNDICYNLVDSVLEGYNGTIFAYGQTGCGKSHTMQGPADIFDKNFNMNEKILSQRGIISRSFEHIFEAISVASGVRYLALVSYLEIYNENIRDLLNPCATSQNLQLKEIPGEGVIVQNLSTHTVHNSQECEELLALGTKNRMVGATLMNAGSSRSHSIFTISLEQIATTSKLEPGETPSIKKGKLNLVDLAGSERQNKTGATGDRLKEATKINLSLSALGNVISALVDGKTKHIPYRDAKLTRLLQDSLGGNTKTLMIACISPAEYNYDETLSTLRYASRAKNIHNKPKINEDPKDTMLREYQEEIIKLRNLLNSTNGGSQHVIVNNNNNNNEAIENMNLVKEKEKLRLMYEEQVRQLKTEYEIEKREKEDLYQNIELIKQEYETKLNNLSTMNESMPKSDFDFDDFPKTKQQSNHHIQQSSSSTNLLNSDDVIERLQVIKDALIGGEKSNDIQLKEKRNKKKLEAEKRLSALAHAISRVEQSEDRDLLQGHYTSIQQELQIKTDSLKKQRQKIRALEREVTDIQAEFQLDRADYLETIRRLEKNMKFYKQMMDIAVPLLRKDGRFWDIDHVKSVSVWNDDLKKWKLCESSLSRRKLPPAIDAHKRRDSTSLTAPGRLESSPSSRNSSTENLNNSSDYETGSPDSSCSPDHDNDFLMKKLKNSDGNSIVDSYFRPKRANELIHQSRAFNTWECYV